MNIASGPRKTNHQDFYHRVLTREKSTTRNTIRIRSKKNITIQVLVPAVGFLLTNSLARMLIAPMIRMVRRMNTSRSRSNLPFQYLTTGIISLNPFDQASFIHVIWKQLGISHVPKAVVDSSQQCTGAATSLEMGWWKRWRGLANERNSHQSGQRSEWGNTGGTQKKRYEQRAI